MAEEASESIIGVLRYMSCMLTNIGTLDCDAALISDTAGEGGMGVASPITPMMRLSCLSSIGVSPSLFGIVGLCWISSKRSRDLSQTPSAEGSRRLRLGRFASSVLKCQSLEQFVSSMPK